MDKLRDLRDKYFQVDDEYLNGYARLCGINATGVYLSLCRHASKQQTCFPSKKLISEELSISERSVYSAMLKLETWGIIQIDGQGRKPDGSFKSKLYSLIDKKYWKPKPQATGADGKKRQSPQANDDTTRRQEVPNKETHINYTHIKETQEEEEPATEVAVISETLEPLKEKKVDEIAETIDLFKKLNPTHYKLFGNIPQRKAVERLLKHIGREKIEKAVQLCEKIVGMKFAPTITTPCELETKWGQLQSFCIKESFSPMAGKNYD